MCSKKVSINLSVRAALKIINLTFITVSLEVIMELKKLDYAMTVCKVASELDIDLNKEFYFIGKTDEEYSLV